jgi:hypothetical protein
MAQKVLGFDKVMEGLVDQHDSSQTDERRYVAHDDAKSIDRQVHQGRISAGVATGK